jgi:hypothetical protein
MLKMKCTDRITNGEDFQRAKEERLLAHGQGIQFGTTSL